MPSRERDASNRDAAVRAVRVTGPELPDEAQILLLDPGVRNALTSLGPVLSELVGRHLAAAGLLVDEEPDRALAHAQVAKSKAARVPAVREAVGIAAYASGDFTLALAELRAAHRMTEAPELIPLLADCERALGHPERALELAAAVPTQGLSREDRIELAIVVSGARRDLGQPEAALRALPAVDMAAERVDGPLLRLWYAYAEALLAGARSDEATQWFTAVADADVDAITDAAERLASF